MDGDLVAWVIFYYSLREDGKYGAQRVHRVIVNHDKIITSLSEHSTLAQPDSIIRGKRRYNLSHEHSRRIFFLSWKVIFY